MKDVIVIVPARYESERFPEKVLCPINGKPLIVHVLERIMGSGVSEIIVATDSEKIRDVVRSSAGCRVEMTKSDHKCGTDRIAEVAARISSEFVLNVQGDELIIGPHMIDQILEQCPEDLHIGTLYTRFEAGENVFDTNIVKVLTNRNGRMIYMSRTPIPHRRGNDVESIDYFKQVGLYLFRRDVLLEFSNLEPTALERIEGIELLRALDYGLPLHGIYSDWPTCDVNVPEDVQDAEKFVGDFDSEKRS